MRVIGGMELWWIEIAVDQELNRIISKSGTAFAI